MSRAIIAVAAVAGALFASWWVPVLAMIILSLRFRAWEVPVIGLLVDLLWLPSGFALVHVPLFTLAGIALVWLFEPVRSKLLV